MRCVLGAQVLEIDSHKFQGCGLDRNTGRRARAVDTRATSEPRATRSSLWSVSALAITQSKLFRVLCPIATTEIRKSKLCLERATTIEMRESKRCPKKESILLDVTGTQVYHSSCFTLRLELTLVLDWTLKSSY